MGKSSREMVEMKGWKRGDLAVYEGGIGNAELTVGDTYVVNNVGKARGHVYLQIVTDDQDVCELLEKHFKRYMTRARP